jgi:hypothetical protein
MTPFPSDLDDPETARWAFAFAEGLTVHVNDALSAKIVEHEQRIARLRQELHDARNQIPPTMRMQGESDPRGGTI